MSLRDWLQWNDRAFAIREQRMDARARICTRLGADEITFAKFYCGMPGCPGHENGEHCSYGGTD